MKLIEIANRIDKSKGNEEYIDIEALAQSFEVPLYYAEQERLKCYWFGNWHCTDAWVGYRMYFLDDVPVCYSFQRGRKSPEDYHWFSRELAMTVKKYLLSLVEEDLSLSLIDLNEEFDDFYKIEFNSQLLSCNRPTLNGVPVEIVERIRETPDYGIDQVLKIRLPSDEEQLVNIQDLDFKFYLD